MPNNDVTPDKISDESKAKLDAAVEPKWLKARLAQNERAVLRAIGVQSIDEAKTLIATAKQTADALVSASAEIDELRAKLEDANKALRYIVTEVLSHLPSVEQEEISEAAKNDPLSIYLAAVLARKSDNK